MNEIRIERWEDFESAVAQIRKNNEQPDEVLFRGQADSSWRLSTTLDRYPKSEISVAEYYKTVHVVKHQIESFTEAKWDIPELSDLNALCAEYDGLRGVLRSGPLPAHSYLTYLRHHGFPSPLLDWTSSPYVATFFAFRDASEKDRAVYAYSEMPAAGKFRSSGQPEIYSVGPYTRAHKRHFLQQSQYTVCLQFHPGQRSAPGEWVFGAHDQVFERGEPDQDLITKLTISAKERTKILKTLDAYNLNAHSLFGSEESLMETLAVREIEFEGRRIL